MEEQKPVITSPSIYPTPKVDLPNNTQAELTPRKPKTSLTRIIVVVIVALLIIGAGAYTLKNHNKHAYVTRTISTSTLSYQVYFDKSATAKVQSGGQVALSGGEEPNSSTPIVFGVSKLNGSYIAAQSSCYNQSPFFTVNVMNQPTEFCFKNGASGSVSDIVVQGEPKINNEYYFITFATSIKGFNDPTSQTLLETIAKSVQIK